MRLPSAVSRVCLPLTALLAAKSARAEVPKLATTISSMIAYDVPDGCPTRDALVARIASRLTTTDDLAWDPRANRFGVQIRPEGTALRGTVHEASASEARELLGATCDELVSAIAWTIALSLDPHASALPAAASVLVTQPIRRAIPPVMPPADGTKAEPLWDRLRIGATGDLFDVGLASPLVGGGLVVELRASSAEPRSRAAGYGWGRSGGWSPVARWAIGYVTESARPDGTLAEFSMGTTALDLTLLELPWGPMSLGLGGTMVFGLVRARGQQVDLPRTVVAPWLAAGGEGVLSWDFSSQWGIELAGSVLESIATPEFVRDAPSAPVARYSALSWRAGLGLTWRISRP